MSGNEIFLATTALHRFWDDDGKNLFLGPWCLPYGKKIEGEVLPYPLDDREDFEEAIRVCGKTYERCLSALAGTLNAVHGSSHPEMYWRILIGPWLLHYVSILYERWLCLRQASFGRELVTKGLARSSYVVRADFNEFMEGIHEDAYNLQLYTQIGEHMGLRFLSREAQAHEAPRSSKSALKSLATSISSRIARSHASVWCSNPRIGRKDWLRLAVDARALPLNRVVPTLKMSVPAIQRPLRETLSRADLGSDPFSRLLTATLADNLPWRYLEGYRASVEKLKGLLRRPPKALVLSTPDYRSEVLFLAAKLKSRRSGRLVTVQHGGSFGMARHSPVESHERRVSDEYWSWGWDDGGAKPMPSFLPAPAAARLAGVILYGGNTMPRYPHRLWSNPIGPQFLQVIRWRHRWIKRLGPEALSRLLVRLYPGDPYGWSQEERLRDEFPAIVLDPGKTTFLQALEECSLFVCDTNHTTLLEAFAMDKPTLLFWDDKLNELRDSAAPFFQGLVEAGVLHHSPEEAAHHVNAVHDDPLKWWRHPRVRAAVEAFKGRFVGASDRPLDAWRRELRRLGGASARPEAAASPFR